MSHTSIGVTPGQKRRLIEFRSLVERETGRDVSQGEAIKIASSLAKEHVSDCNAALEREHARDIE